MQAKLLMRRVEERIGAEARDALQSYQSALAKLNAARNSRAAAEAVYASEVRRFHQGESTTFLVLQRQVQLAQARGLGASGADAAQSIGRRAAARRRHDPHQQRRQFADAGHADARALTMKHAKSSRASSRRRDRRPRACGVAQRAHLGPDERLASAARDPADANSNAKLRCRPDGRAGIPRARSRAEQPRNHRCYAESVRGNFAAGRRGNGAAQESRAGDLRFERPDRALPHRSGQSQLRRPAPRRAVVELLRDPAGESLLRRTGNRWRWLYLPTVRVRHAWSVLHDWPRQHRAAPVFFSVWSEWANRQRTAVGSGHYANAHL